MISCDVSIKKSIGFLNASAHFWSITHARDVSAGIANHCTGVRFSVIIFENHRYLTVFWTSPAPFRFGSIVRRHYHFGSGRISHAGRQYFWSALGCLCRWRSIRSALVNQLRKRQVPSKKKPLCGRVPIRPNAIELQIVVIENGLDPPMLRFDFPQLMYLLFAFLLGLSCQSEAPDLCSYSGSNLLCGLFSFLLYSCFLVSFHWISLRYRAVDPTNDTRYCAPKRNKCLTLISFLQNLSH
jgi:hypothetical protein